MEAIHLITDGESQIENSLKSLVELNHVPLVLAQYQSKECLFVALVTIDFSA